MAKKANRRNQANPHKETLAATRGPLPAEAIRQKLDLHRSGASGPHASSGVAPTAAAGRKTRMGSRRAQNAAAIKDTL